MHVIGTLATIASLVITVLGFPSQIIKNYRRKSCEGLAPSLVYTAFLTYALWTAYAWVKPDWFLVVAQTPGCAVALVVIIQMFYYRKTKDAK